MLISAQNGEKTLAGKITYMSSQNVYVRFESTKNIKAGDTLYFEDNKRLVPVLIVSNLSSTSCVCLPIAKNSLSTSMSIFARIKPEQDVVENKTEIIIAPVTENKKDSVIPVPEEKSKLPEFPQRISGSVSASSYSWFSNFSDIKTTRFQYQFILDARNIGNSKISTEVNTLFRHETDKWNLVQDNLFYGLKIYNLSVKYDNRKTKVMLGRKINPKISNVGAIDGLQFEHNTGKFYGGAIAGFRPDYQDYSFNFSLPQFGIYAGHVLANNNGQMQNTLAFFEQRNNTMTDRRFVYFQHLNSLAKNLSLFVSAEMDLYKNIDSVAQNTLDLTNAYLLLTYRINKKFNISASYDNRKNVIYYESYKSYINRLLEIEARQGFSFQAGYHSLKNISFGMRAGYRLANKNSSETMNFYGYFTYNNLTDFNLSLTAAANYLETSYINGKILSINLSQFGPKGKLYSDLGYQLVYYDYLDTETPTVQNIVNLGLNYLVASKTSIALNLETCFENSTQSSRLNVQIRQRF